MKVPPDPAAQQRIHALKEQDTAIKGQLDDLKAIHDVIIGGYQEKTDTIENRLDQVRSGAGSNALPDTQVQQNILKL